VVGDWNGDGTTDIGVTNGQTWYLDMNNNGIWDAGDRVNNFGLPGWTPIVGDWNGDRKGTKLGVYKDGSWYLDTNGDGAFGSGDSVYTFGLPGWTSVAGKWS
jgi:hypothetical protein